MHQWYKDGNYTLIQLYRFCNYTDTQVVINGVLSRVDLFVNQFAVCLL